MRGSSRRRAGSSRPPRAAAAPVRPRDYALLAAVLAAPVPLVYRLGLPGSGFTQGQVLGGAGVYYLLALVLVAVPLLARSARSAEEALTARSCLVARWSCDAAEWRRFVAAERRAHPLTSWVAEELRIPPAADGSRVVSIYPGGLTINGRFWPWTSEHPLLRFTCPALEPVRLLEDPPRLEFTRRTGTGKGRWYATICVPLGGAGAEERRRVFARFARTRFF